jgi:glyoxylase-like metal-dependent hydrolase (beta-lactamase superfamily II)
MIEIPFKRDFKCEYGVLEEVAPNLRRIVATNKSPFTWTGTGTYVIGRGKVCVIDPGPLLDDHVRALIDGLKGEEVTHILITHTHGDHSPAAKPLKEATGAPTFGYGPHGAGKYEQGVIVEAGGDRDFVPDIEVCDGDVIEGDGFSFECVYTPGHTSNHMCYAWREQKALFTGDHVMGWSTTVVSPPDGDMAEYVDSLRKLLDRDDALYYPTHAGAITDPKPYVRALITHREEREAQILDCLKRGKHVIADMVDEMYVGLNPNLVLPARRSVFAHIVDLADRGRVKTEAGVKLALDARYSLA